ncbi:FAD-binding and (Fe-S)-binding domain-containing protein [Halalkalicoccus sp. NIPERK01]|uniref:FAD-binding and (Fe-S)-binding domain-containing protein n=1 Tax=Halalkalicoccus sp. NIPERK01 TaxID=3053469 RepID=UPI00256ECA86|nr:FAD-binding and (Fe-S)-binding domain-containing protein [Halalkalicoccus sp. NIPERK01]MDL5360752.1 FAD-linked oxidase C-terminal domain-containing protein [Halalkalicoccus sp. NIPERK01]
MATSDRHDPATDDRANYDYTNGDVERPDLVADLEARVDGDVRFDEYSRELYATDASAYEVTPIGVVFPTSTDDVAAVMGYCAEREIPVLPRGGGTSLAGQAVNEAVVLDFTRYMSDITGVDPDARRARAQTGITLGELNRALEPEGLKFAPDPSTADRSALGGAIGNNTTGAHSLLYGKTDAYVEECEAVLSDGSVHTFGEIAVEELREGADPEGELVERIYAEVVRVLDEECEAVEERYPSMKRNVSGYNLDVLVEEAHGEGATEEGVVNLARLLVGSEGTLAIVTEAEVALEPIPETKAVGLLTYHSLLEAMEDVGPILEHEPAALEVLDGVLVDLARGLDEFKDVIGMLPDETDTFLLVEFYADSDEERRERVETLLEDRVGEIAFDGYEAYDEETQKDFWKMRKASTPILLSRTGDEKHIAFIEDIAIPPEHLPEYTAEFKEVFENHDTFGSFYAHAGPGCMHVRPLIDTKTAEGVETMVSISDAATDLAVKYGGSVSGEHGDGRARTQWNKKLYGEHLWEVFRDLKTAFDPDWLLNPGSVCGDFDMSENLRFGPDYEFEAGFEPELNWENENGFQGMAELCHGCGGCRTSQDGAGGVMCPTYRASHEEITSTRGRANMLRQAMSGDLPEEEQFDVEFMHEVMDLCVGCKGCARDCPSEVDMAKMKVEVEHEYHRCHGVDLRSRVFARIDWLSDLGSATAPISNLASSLPGSGLVTEKVLGIARERTLPAFESETLTEWYEKRGPKVSEAEADRKVLLFPDTFTDHNNTEAGKAAIRVLEAANVHVKIPEGVTGSGRPAHSKGLIDLAREKADRNVTALAPDVNAGWDVVVVEPSDAVMFQLDYLDLLSGDAVERVAEKTYDVMEYIDRFRLDEAMRFAETDESLTYHGHCHQKAIKKDHHTVGVLRRAGYRVDPLDSGCCGMAGSFGYEAEHYSMSQAVGSVLFGQIEESEGESVVAPGSSCRSQIGDEYGEKPPHPVRKLAEALA